MARFAHTLSLLCCSAAVLVGCQTVTEESAQDPSSQPLPTLSVPVVITAIPTPIPAASPTAAPPPTGTRTPSPTPTADPTPAPTPTPPPPNGNCTPGGGSGTGNQCRVEGAQFLGDVMAAIDDVVASNPTLFNLNDMKGEKGYKVLDPSLYQDKVAIRLRQKGYCAQVDNYEEIGVKLDNAFAESYDIILSTNHIRRGPSSYTVTCRPPWF